MPLNETWSTTVVDLFGNSDFGFLGNLIPIILILGISWAISKKPRDMLFIQFPLVLVFKVFFPFFHFIFIIISFALFIMNLLGSKGDLLADVKESPQKIQTIAKKVFRAEKQRDQIRDIVNQMRRDSRK